MVAGTTVDSPRSATNSVTTQTHGLAPDQHGAAHTVTAPGFHPETVRVPRKLPLRGGGPLRVTSAELPPANVVVDDV
jgi:hypothetical protein